MRRRSEIVVRNILGRHREHYLQVLVQQVAGTIARNRAGLARRRDRQLLGRGTSGTVDYTVEPTLQHPMRGTSPIRLTLSSAHLTATSSLTNFLRPLAGIRITSASVGSTVLILTALQNAGG